MKPKNIIAIGPRTMVAELTGEFAGGS